MSTEKITRVEEVTKYVVRCDLCGGDQDVPRYSENRTCQICGRDACNKCQHIEGGEFGFIAGTSCIRCHSLEEKYRDPINATYRERDRLRLAWKEESLLSSPAAISPIQATESDAARKDK